MFKSKPFSLQKPIFPQAINGTIDINQLHQLGETRIVARITRWFNAGNGDNVFLFFGKQCFQAEVTSKTDTTIEVLCDYSLIPNGSYDVYYTAQNLACNLNSSDSASITIINSSATSGYPAPYFPAALYDEPHKQMQLYYEPTVAMDGATIAASYRSMQVGDVVTFYLSGTDSSGEPISAATQTLSPVTVTSYEFNRLVISTLAPASALLALGNGGTIRAYYTVTSGSDTRSSEEGAARMSWTDIAQYQINAPQFMPPISDDFPYARCMVTIFGPPGTPFNASVNSPVEIVGGGTTITDGMPDDTRCVYRFSIDLPSTVTVGGGITTPIVAQADSLNPDTSVEPGQGHATFMDFKPYSGDIESYAFSTGAAADGTVPCSFYIKGQATTPATTAHVKVTKGSAFIPGHGQEADLPLNDKKCLFFELHDLVAENVQVSITLNGTTLPLTASFVPFPSMLYQPD